MIRSTLDRLLPVVGRASIMYRSTSQPSSGRHVDRGSIEVSIATIERHLIAGVISTHDPRKLIFYFWTLAGVAKYWPNVGHLSINMSVKVSADIESAKVATECWTTYQLMYWCIWSVAVGRCSAQCCCLFLADMLIDTQVTCWLLRDWYYIGQYLVQYRLNVLLPIQEVVKVLLVASCY